MRYKNELQKLMHEELPPITYQRRKAYKTSIKEISYLYELLNREVFNNKLYKPKFYLVLKPKLYFGYCTPIPHKANKKAHCTISLTKSWACKQWLIMILAHEMCHQYQWDILSKERISKGLKPVFSHGPTFFMHKKKLLKYDIPLKKIYNFHGWLRTQNLFKY